MSSYDETIAAAKLAKEAAAQRAIDAAARQKEAEQRASAEALAFLKAVVVPEVEKARAALEAAGYPAEIGNGEGASGVRCSLHMTQANKSLVFTAGFEPQQKGGANPKISAADPDFESYPIKLEQLAVENMIGIFLEKAINPKPRRRDY